jgi:FkbM family methyltransferase
MIQERLKRLALRFLPDRLLLGLKKIHYIRALRCATEDRETDLQIVRYLVRPGDTVVDIGANFGIYTAALSNCVGAEGKVISIEPVPQTYDLLASNIRKLGLKNVEGFNMAISSRDGSAWMEIPRFASGGENFYEARIIPDQTAAEVQTVEVPARTLDSLLERYPEIDFIKCDVEGHEAECLRGAEQLLERAQPAWLIEVSGNPEQRHSPANRIFRTLAELGYRCYWFTGRELRPRQRGDRSTNYFFLQPQHLARIPAEYFGEEREYRHVA